MPNADSWKYDIFESKLRAVLNMNKPSPTIVRCNMNEYMLM